MRSTSHASPDDIDITSIWGALKRSGKSLILASLLTGGATYAVLSMMAPRFSSEAQLTVMAKGTANPFSSPKVDMASPDSLGVRMDKEAVNTHVRGLMSPDLISKIATELKLNTMPEFNSALGSSDKIDALLRVAGLSGPRPGESERDRVLGAFSKRLEVYSPKESRFIGIRFTSSDAQLAADVANRLAESYRASLAQQTVDETDSVQKALEPKVERLREEVSQAQAAVERFKSAKDLFKGGAQKTGLNEQQLGDLTTELTRTKALRSEADSRARSAREMMKLGTADALPDVQKSPLIQALVQQRVRLEREISELSATLLPAHPRMRQLHADLDGLKRQLNGEVAKLVDSLEKEAKVAAMREASIAKSLDEIKSQVSATSADEVELRQLEDISKSKRAELERLQAQYEANKVKADSGVVPVEAQIISRASASSVPFFPKKLPFTALVMLATALFGMAWVITRALLNGARVNTNGRHPLRRASDYPAAVAEPVATAAVASASRDVRDLPRVPVFERRPEPVHSEPAPEAASDSDVAEIATIAKLARHIRAHSPDKGGFRTLIAGATSGIDASYEALSLADDLVREGLQTIVIDWSLDEDGFARKIGLDVKPGFNDLVMGDASFEDVIRSLPDGKVHLIASGSSLGGMPVETALDPDKLNLLLDALDEAYDQIIVVATEPDARILFEAIQGRFDAGVTVAEAKRTTAVLQDPPGTFLGFEVTDITLVRFTRADVKPQGTQRIVRRGIGSDSELRPV